MHCVHAGWHEYSLIHFVFESDAAFSVVSKLFCTSFVLSSSLEFLQAFIGCPEKKNICAVQLFCLQALFGGKLVNGSFAVPSDPMNPSGLAGRNCLFA